MPKIDSKQLARLQSKGLYISEPFPVGHPWSDGVRVAKPKGVAGNSISDYRLKCDGIELSAPPVVLYSEAGSWIVITEECVPQGPNDIENTWSTQEEAVEDILDFFFGDPARMQKLDV